VEEFRFEELGLVLRKGEKVIERDYESEIHGGQNVIENGQTGRLPRGRMRGVEHLLGMVLVEMEVCRNSDVVLNLTEAVTLRQVTGVVVFCDLFVSGRGLVHRMKLRMPNPLQMKYLILEEQFEAGSCLGKELEPTLPSAHEPSQLLQLMSPDGEEGRRDPETAMRRALHLVG